MLKDAIWYSARGWYVLACAGTQDGVCQCPRQAQCPTPGKHPLYHHTLLPHGVKSATSDSGILKSWWDKWPSANIGIATGPSNLLVFDVDPRSGGEETILEFNKQYGFPSTLTAETGSGGVHLIYAWPSLSMKTPKTLGPGVDLKGLGGYIIAPPSVHKSGKQYRWLDKDHSIENVPRWFIDKFCSSSSIDYPTHLSKLRGPLLGPPPMLELIYEELGSNFYSEPNDGKSAVKCPWSDEHSEKDLALNTSTVIFEGGGFHCFHGHCDGRTAVDAVARLRKLYPEAYEKASQKFDEAEDRYHRGILNFRTS